MDNILQIMYNTVHKFVNPYFIYFFAKHHLQGTDFIYETDCVCV